MTKKKQLTLITRHKKRALPLIKLLEKQGCKVITEPIFKIIPLKHKKINFNDYSAIMITSLNTIEILSKKNSYNKLKKIKTFCVGNITYNAAKKEGYNCIFTKATSGKSLEKEIINSINPSNKKILIIGGKKIAYNPISNFNKANLSSERIIIYDTKSIKCLSNRCQEAIKNKIIKNIIVYSPETAKMLLNLINHHKIKETKIICLGQKTGNIFKKHNWKKIQVINNINLKNFANAVIED
tara:strand:- start:30974 stop:31693 length:720 start_codon:yes stop_codon:yes gene_type:complete